VRAGRPPIVSSAHLAEGATTSLSEVEFGLIVAHNAFQRWVVHCAKAAGVAELGYLDILVLHNVNHRDRPKRLSDICFVLNVEDTHTVSYGLRKLIRLGLAVGTRQGKETIYGTTDAGHEFCRRYARARDRCLLSAVQGMGGNPDTLAETADILRLLSGLYDQAARAAASL